MKNNKQPTTNKPVLTIGTKQDAKTHPTNGWLFLNGMNTKPAINPANEVFSKTTKIVAQALTPMNAPTSPTNKFNNPSTNPRMNPPNGPNIQAPKAIGTSVKLRVSVPNFISFDNPNKQTSIAVSIPSPVIVLVVKYFFILGELYIKTILLQ